MLEAVKEFFTSPEWERSSRAEARPGEEPAEPSVARPAPSPLPLSRSGEGWRSRSGERQFDSKNRAVRAVPVPDLYVTVMRLNDRAHDGKAHAHSMILGGKERVEDLFCGVLRYPRPCVGDGDLGEPPVSRRRHRDCFLGVRRIRRCVKPIQDQIGNTCCNWIGSPLIRRGAPFILLRRTIARDLASGARNLSVSATWSLISMAFFSKGTFLMKLRKLRTTSDARPLSRCMSSTISFICFMSGDRDSSRILAVSVLFRIAPSGWFISCAIPAAISPAVEKRLTCASSSIRCRASISAD